MAEIKSVMTCRTLSDAFNAIKDCWEWTDIQDIKNINSDIIGKKLYVNADTFIKLHYKGSTTFVTLDLYFKSQNVLSLGSTNNDNCTNLYVIKTNTATIIQYDNNNKLTPIETTAIILSTATNHYTGVKEKVVAFFKRPVIDASGSAEYNSSCICSKEINKDGLNARQTVENISGGSAVSTLTPFFYALSQTTLDDVFLFTSYQPSELYRGDCTINGRRYYVCNLIAVLDE
jgi:hypothetical protein